MTQSGHPLSLERYDHDQTFSQKFDCRLDPGWCHPRCHCSDTDAADADHQDSGRRHLRPWHGHVAGSAHFADRGSRDRATLSHGKIDQWYSSEDQPGVVFVLNMTDTQAAHAVLEELPLGKAHLMTFQLTPIGPLNPLRQLLVPAVPH